MGVVDEASSLVALRAALGVAARNRGAPGPDGVTVAELAAQGDVELVRLRDEVLSGAYRPRPSRRVLLPKPGGGHRGLAIGCVRDRVVQHAVAAALAATFDGELHRFAYAYRRGRSTHDALAAVDAALGAGNDWVLRGDVESFFDRIPPPLLLAALDEVCHEPDLVKLVEGMLAAGSLAGGEIADSALGTPQGSPLSPFLANLYLAPFDRAVEAERFEMVRYGDDVCIGAVSRQEAERARGVVARALGRLRLALNEKKVEIRHLGEGFTFLGFRFGPGGRTAGPRAVREIGARLDEVLRTRPSDGGEEIDDLLRGWLAYYGSLAGVQLPERVRARAEELEAQRTETLQVGRLPPNMSGSARAWPVEPPNPRHAPVDDRVALAGEAARAPRTSVWQTLATQLAGAVGTADENAVRDRIRDRAGIDTTAGAELAAAIGRFDGATAAEILARSGRFGDAADVAKIARPETGGAPPTDTRKVVVPAAEEDAQERPHLAPGPGDAERLLERFGGAEHVFLRDMRVGDRVERERVLAPLTADRLREHLAGSCWLGVYPLRGNHSVRFAAVRVVIAGKARHGDRREGAIAGIVAVDARALRSALESLGVRPLLSVEPGRGHVVWVLFAEPVGAARARTLLSLACQRAGAPPPGVTRELVPAQDVAKPDKPGTGVLLPLGADPRKGSRAWLLDEAFAPVPDPLGLLRDHRAASHEEVAAAVGVRRALAALTAPAAPPAAGAPAVVPRAQEPESSAAPPGPSAGASTTAVPEPRAGGPVDVVALMTAPFRELPRAKEIYAGCAVFRSFVDKVISGHGLATSERYFVADVLGRLGDESTPAVDAVLRHLDDYRPGMAGRVLQRLYPRPTSCGRIRQNLPELTARVGCDCHFRVPPGAYPTPVLHAIGAANVPGLADRVLEAAAKGGIARAAVAAMNEGRKELGTKAAALCNRLSDLRRQVRAVEKTITSVEAEIDLVIEEAGDSPLETPAGTLRRVIEGGVRRFVLEV